jgi:hypothetical protein
MVKILVVPAAPRMNFCTSLQSQLHDKSGSVGPLLGPGRTHPYICVRCEIATRDPLSLPPPLYAIIPYDFKVQPIREANPAYPLYMHCCLTGTAHNRWTRDSGRDKPGAEMNQRVLPTTPLFSIPADCLPHEKLNKFYSPTSTK